MKRRYKLAALLLILALLPGCAAQEQPIRVTLVLKTTVETAEFWEQVMDGVDSAVGEFGVELTVTGASAETEVEEQISVMEDVIETAPDVIILVASDFDRLVPVTEQAAEAGIRIITMDSDVNTDVRATYVASDNYQIGRSLGRQLLETVQAGQVAVLTHSAVASSGIDRARGAADVMSVVPEIEVVGVYDCGNDRTLADEITETLLSDYPELAGFVCTNEVCNLAVADRLADNGLSGLITVIGCDNSQQQIQFLEQNTLQGIVIQRPFNMGYVAVEQAVRVCRGETVPAFTEIPCVSITRDNMYNSENQKLLFPF